MTHTPSIAHSWRLLTLLVVAIVSLSLASPSATASVAPSSTLAVQFFQSVGGETPWHLLGNDAVLHTPEGTFRGSSGPAQFGEALGASFSDVQFAVNSVAHASSDYVIASFTLTGINTGSYRGLDANCAAIAVPGVALLHLFEATVIANWWPMHSDPYAEPPLETVTVVTEQWVNYDADVVASQIAAFNALDSTFRPDCSDHRANSTDVVQGPESAPDLIPSCHDTGRCAIP